MPTRLLLVYEEEVVNVRVAFFLPKAQLDSRYVYFQKGGTKVSRAREEKKVCRERVSIFWYGHVCRARHVKSHSSMFDALLTFFCPAFSLTYAKMGKGGPKPNPKKVLPASLALFGRCFYGLG